MGATEKAKLLISFVLLVLSVTFVDFLLY